MKIAMANVFLPNSQPAGVAFQVHYLANQLVRRGHDVTLFTHSPAYGDCLYDVHTFPHPDRLPLRLYAFAQAVRLAGSNLSRFDVVHAHGDSYLLWNSPAQVRTFHGSARDEARAARALRRKLWYTVTAALEASASRIAAWNVGVSEATRASIPRIDEVIPCGIDTTVFRPGAKSPRPSILFVGGLEGRKRGQLLFDVFVRDVRRRVPDAELWLVSEHAPAAEGVRLLGKLPTQRLAELYRSAWVYCMPSTYEGFGVPYIEAMASGTMVVATPNAGADEVLERGRRGVLCADDALGDTLVNALTDPGERDRYVAAGLEHAARFDWTRICGAYERAYTRVIEQRPSLVRRLTRPVAAQAMAGRVS